MTFLFLPFAIFSSSVIFNLSGALAVDDNADKLEGNDAVAATKQEKKPLVVVNRISHLLARARGDFTTVLTFSITFHYTPQAKEYRPNIRLEVAKITSGIDTLSVNIFCLCRSYIQKHVDDVNEGFANSKIPLRAVIHCIRQSKIMESKHSNAKILRIFFEADSKLASCS